MPLYNVKYSDITTPVLNYMLNNCQNLDSRFDSIPLCFKAGYSITVNQSHTWNKKGRKLKVVNILLYIDILFKEKLSINILLLKFVKILLVNLIQVIQ